MQQSPEISADFVRIWKRELFISHKFFKELFVIFLIVESRGWGSIYFSNETFEKWNPLYTFLRNDSITIITLTFRIELIKVTVYTGTKMFIYSMKYHHSFWNPNMLYVFWYVLHLNDWNRKLAPEEWTYINKRSLSAFLLNERIERIIIFLLQTNETKSFT